MTVKVKLRTLISSSQALGSISNLPLRGKTAFRIAKAVNVVNIELEAFDKARENLIGQYIKDREAQPPVYVGENKAERKESEDMFNKEVGELLDSEVEINTEKIKEEMLENVEGLRPIWLSSLDWLFEE